MDHTAGEPLLVGHYDQSKSLGDTHWGLDFEGRPCIRNIANGAIDDAAAELNLCGLQDSVTEVIRFSILNSSSSSGGSQGE